MHKMKILITGATGLIGQELGKSLAGLGHEIIVVSRNQEKAILHLPFPCSVIEADLSQQQIPAEKLQGIEVVYHLAGESIGDGRWSTERKNKIIESRVKTTANLMQSLKTIASVNTIICSSAIGFYGDRQDEILTEKSTAGQGFLSEVCQQWENTFHLGLQNLNHSGVRGLIVRTAVVLSPFGGALEKMKLPFLFGMGSALGNGQQWMSWIHIQDLIRIFVQALSNPKLNGVLNAVAPEAVTNLKLSSVLAEELKTKLRPNVPAFILKVMLGEMSTLILDSQRVQSENLLKDDFLYPEIHSALKDCLQYHQGHDFYYYAQQFIPYPKNRVFQFFAAAENLEKITPQQLHFHILAKSTKDIHEGTLIDYRLEVHGFPFGWRTLIQKWLPTDEFVDVQLKGPYWKWHHQHVFHELRSGTLMTDLVRYQVPFGRVGYLLAGYLVKKDIHFIFEYRRRSVRQEFR
jgi:uncharacterized protein (TIGR01777 family)